jgi:hypothetical protein
VVDGEPSTTSVPTRTEPGDKIMNNDDHYDIQKLARDGREIFDEILVLDAQMESLGETTLRWTTKQA